MLLECAESFESIALNIENRQMENYWQTNHDRQEHWLADWLIVSHLVPIECSVYVRVCACFSIFHLLKCTRSHEAKKERAKRKHIYRPMPNGNLPAPIQQFRGFCAHFLSLSLLHISVSFYRMYGFIVVVRVCKRSLLFSSFSMNSVFLYRMEFLPLLLYH